jgi:hypothetical protein
VDCNYSVLSASTSFLSTIPVVTGIALDANSVNGSSGANVSEMRFCR